MDVPRIISFLVLGVLAGSLIGRLVKGRKEGYGLIQNVLVGCAGALLGGFVFWFFNISFGLDHLKITFDDLVAALLGTVVVILLVKMLGRKKAKTP